MHYRDIITIEAGKRGGKPCIRGLRHHWITSSARSSNDCDPVGSKRSAVIVTCAETCQNPPMRPSQALASKRADILALAAARGATRMRVFGSVANGLDHEGSDIDLLVDVPDGTSLLRIVGLQLEIEDTLGVKVDLCTERELHPDLKQRILAQARPL